MVAFSVLDFGGEIPKVDDRLIGPNAAGAAWNCDLVSGPLDGLPETELVVDLSAAPGSVQRAYRLPGPDPGARDPDAWLPLPSAFSSPVRSPLANDTLHRIYWTNPYDLDRPDQAGAYWSTYARIAAGLPPYDLGFLPPPPAAPPLRIRTSGGTASTDVPYVERSYLFTLVDEYGLESSPSTPSLVVAGASDGAWLIDQFPFVTNTPAASGPGGVSPKPFYPRAVFYRLYRTVSGQNTGAEFYRVVDLPINVQTFYTDIRTDLQVVLDTPLPSASWASPPRLLDGLTAMPGGFLVGFTGNTLHFCEPNRPHAWPASYDISVQFQIVGLGLWNQTLMVLTQGFPSTVSGAHPSAMTPSQVQAAEPCVARGSIVVDLLGVYYASQNGLVMLSYYGMQNQTLLLLAKNMWLGEFRAVRVIACRHRTQYLALNGGPGAGYQSGGGFLIDYSEQRLGLVNLDTFDGATCIWNDSYDGSALLMADKKVYRWDGPNTALMPWRWRSKIFVLPKPGNLGAARVTFGPEIGQPVPQPVPPSELSGIALAAGVHCLFRLFADGEQVWEKVLDRQTHEFRLPSGFKAHEYQFELVSRVPVFRVDLASTMRELHAQ